MGSIAKLENAAVGRVASTDGTDGQHLPTLQTSAMHPVAELSGRGSKITNPSGSACGGQ